MKWILALVFEVIFCWDLALCQNVNTGYNQNSYTGYPTGYNANNQNGYTGTGYTQPSVAQIPSPTYSKTTTYQAQPNGVQASSVQETIQDPSSGVQQTVVTKTVTSPIGQPGNAFGNQGMNLNNGYGRKKRNVEGSLFQAKIFSGRSKKKFYPKYFVKK